jgi:hypothetical protein
MRGKAEPQRTRRRREKREGEAKADSLRDDKKGECGFPSGNDDGE